MFTNIVDPLCIGDAIEIIENLKKDDPYLIIFMMITKMNSEIMLKKL